MRANTETTLCSGCHVEMEAGVGTAPSWSNTFLCPTCETERLAKEQAAREQRKREAVILWTIAHDADKKLDIAGIKCGADEYAQQFSVTRNGHTYRVSVEERDD